MKLKFRRYFFSGLGVLLPIVITLYVLAGIFKFADGLVGKYLDPYLKRTIGYTIPGAGLLATIVLIFLVGIFATNFLGRRFFPFIENLFVKLPLVKQIYPPAKKIVGFLFTREKREFKQVVMVEYPRKGAYSVGFITSEGIREANRKTGKKLLTVFIPASPSPLTGFFVLFPQEEVIFLDISVEEALKMVISGGVLVPKDEKNLEDKTMPSKTGKGI